MSTLELAGLLTVAGGIWLFAGVAVQVRARLAERATDWLLPDRQPWTFRIAVAIAALARVICPKRYTSFSLTISDMVEAMTRARSKKEWLSALVRRSVAANTRETSWPGPDEAISELIADLRAGERVLDPVRMTSPLLGRALRFRFLFTLNDIVFRVTQVVTITAVVLYLMLLGAVGAVVFGLAWIAHRRPRRRHGDG
jgi:hypothetical protein